MQWLEHRLPPPVVGLLCGWGMWLAAPGWSWDSVGMLRGSAAVALLLAGLALDALGLLAFRRARTTFNPLQPQRTSSLVVSGVYRVTRNPMYLGMALQLSGWALVLGSLPAWGGPLLFVGFITRFQIVPEERVMAAKFGPAFTAYCTQVRRWL
ncbi:isoprenylcysteine carboxylmethyltransferase family protein [Curvibacter sp. APW13]|uniref:methyltransferase family protein n=1 Tax=Curvibacter sp. APW13 TaxID=3077236 RepID=UPI0028DDB0F9|nr:isoprenylcysteine carboxylmethyltransferase family protein [Curvibacter sp. APW13]MDT8990375.1 isoprenylcysteine carboxylmethyltransferase family protein [Curvibacter sp. APW13]